MEQKVLFKVHMPKSVDKPLLEVLHSGFIGQGKKVDEFEKNNSEIDDQKRSMIKKY